MAVISSFWWNKCCLLILHLFCNQAKLLERLKEFNIHSVCTKLTSLLHKRKTDEWGMRQISNVSLYLAFLISVFSSVLMVSYCDSYDFTIQMGRVLFVHSNWEMLPVKNKVEESCVIFRSSSSAKCGSRPGVGIPRHRHIFILVCRSLAALMITYCSVVYALQFER